MAYQVRRNAQGLINNYNKFTAPPGALAVADNVIINADDQIERRPGYDKCSSGLPASKPDKLFTHNNTLYVNTNSKIYYKDNLCTYRLVNGNSPAIGTPVSVHYRGGNLYIATKNSIISINVATGYVSRVGSSIIGADRYYQVSSSGNYLYFASPSYACVGRYDFNTRVFDDTWSFPGTSGYLDGPIGIAEFSEFRGSWANGNSIYIFDSGNGVIRHIDIATNMVSTVAGTAGVFGFVDGVGAAARFQNDDGYVWSDGTFVYIIDSGNAAIRKLEIATNNVTTLLTGSITKGIVGGLGNSLFVVILNGIYIVDRTTGAKQLIAGSLGGGYVDGRGFDAKFGLPSGLGIDGNNLYVADTVNNLIRKVDLSQSPTATSTVSGVYLNNDITFGYPIININGPS